VVRNPFGGPFYLFIYVGCGIFIPFYNFLEIKKARKEKYFTYIRKNVKCLMENCDPYFFLFVVVLSFWLNGKYLVCLM
jgi:hypothetical protein